MSQEFRPYTNLAGQRLLDQFVHDFHWSLEDSFPEGSLTPSQHAELVLFLRAMMRLKEKLLSGGDQTGLLLEY